MLSLVAAEQIILAKRFSMSRKQCAFGPIIERQRFRTQTLTHQVYRRIQWIFYLGTPFECLLKKEKYTRTHFELGPTLPYNPEGKIEFSVYF